MAGSGAERPTRQHDEVAQFFDEFVSKNRRRPTDLEIAEKFGLTRQRANQIRKSIRDKRGRTLGSGGKEKIDNDRDLLWEARSAAIDRAFDSSIETYGTAPTWNYLRAHLKSTKEVKWSDAIISQTLTEMRRNKFLKRDWTLSRERAETPSQKRVRRKLSDDIRHGRPPRSIKAIADCCKVSRSTVQTVVARMARADESVRDFVLVNHGDDELSDYQFQMVEAVNLASLDLEGQLGRKPSTSEVARKIDLPRSNTAYWIEIMHMQKELE